LWADVAALLDRSTQAVRAVDEPSVWNERHGAYIAAKAVRAR
jgi:hypothetical protein